MVVGRSGEDRVRDGLTVSHVVILVGLGLIGVGAVLPWVNKDLPVKVYVLGMQTGLERIWVRRLLVVAGVGLLVEAVLFVTSDRRVVLDLVLVGIGGIIAVITVATSPLTGSWMPARGVFVTLVGSVLVVLGSGIPLIMPQSDSNSRSLRFTEN